MTPYLLVLEIARLIHHAYCKDRLPFHRILIVSNSFQIGVRSSR